VASQLQQRLVAHELRAASLRKQCAQLAAARQAAENEARALREANEALRLQLNQAVAAGGAAGTAGSAHNSASSAHHSASSAHHSAAGTAGSGTSGTSGTSGADAADAADAAATGRSPGGVASVMDAAANEPPTIVTATGVAGSASAASIGCADGRASDSAGTSLAGMLLAGMPLSQGTVHVEPLMGADPSSSSNIGGLLSPGTVATLAAAFPLGAAAVNAAASASALPSPEASSDCLCMPVLTTAPSMLLPSPGASSVMGTSLQPLRAEILSLEERHHELVGSHEALLAAVRVAMSCLPPPLPANRTGSQSAVIQSPRSPSASNGSGRVAAGGSGSSGGGTGGESTDALGAASPPLVTAESREASLEASPAGAVVGASNSEAVDASTSSGGAAGGGDGGGGDRQRSASDDFEHSVIQRLAADLCSSARQAAHANARLGHAMASEREQHKAALALSQRRLSYLSADVNARLLFAVQPARHATPPAMVTFAAMMLPAMRNGLPTHWLSPESVESLRRWCEDESSLSLQAIRFVIGRVVHVAGPITVPAAGAGDNPYNLPVGEQYFVVHAEMMMQHRWI
jgi:hypothetical protein